MFERAKVKLIQLTHVRLPEGIMREVLSAAESAREEDGPDQVSALQDQLRTAVAKGILESERAEKAEAALKQEAQHCRDALAMCETHRKERDEARAALKQETQISHNTEVLCATLRRERDEALESLTGAKEAQACAAMNNARKDVAIRQLEQQLSERPSQEVSAKLNQTIHAVRVLARAIKGGAGWEESDRLAQEVLDNLKPL